MVETSGRSAKSSLIFSGTVDAIEILAEIAIKPSNVGRGTKPQHCSSLAGSQLGSWRREKVPGDTDRPLHMARRV